MAITLGAELALALHLDNEPTYAQLEAALVGAGFVNYTILRTVNYDGSSDAQIYVRNAPDSNGIVASLDAAVTLQAVTDSITALAAQNLQPSP